MRAAACAGLAAATGASPRSAGSRTADSSFTFTSLQPAPGVGRNSLSAWRNSVSYTHLDVYKRQHHYSGGNATQMGIFSMFYGLYGNYWFPLIKAGRSPLLMDVLQQQNYQFSLHTSQSFTYPPFDKTVFLKMNPGDMHALSGGPQPWERDRQNIDDILRYIDARDPARPFMTYMFFEGTHANYTFPDDSVCLLYPSSERSKTASSQSSSPAVATSRPPSRQTRNSRRWVSVRSPKGRAHSASSATSSGRSHASACLGRPAVTTFHPACWRRSSG